MKVEYVVTVVVCDRHRINFLRVSRPRISRVFGIDTNLPSVHRQHHHTKIFWITQRSKNGYSIPLFYMSSYPVWKIVEFLVELASNVFDVNRSNVHSSPTERNRADVPSQ